MSSETARTTRPPGARRLVLGLVAAMLVAGCGSADDAPAANPRGESVTDRGQPVRVHFSRPGDAEGESYGVEMDVIARGADHSRTKLELLVAGRVDETILFIRDGNRALLHQAEAKTPYTLMEAADEHPEDLPWESSPLDPDSDLLLRVCPSPDAAGTRTILDREAVGYACTWKDPDEGMDQPEKIWLDKATRMLLEYGPMKATEFVVDPEIAENTFSTKPPDGADVHVVKATGKTPPPDQGEDEPAPEDALATIASTSPIPIYYLGPEFAGATMSDVSIWDDDSGSEVPGDMSIDEGQTLYISYGDDFEMSTTRFVPGNYRNAVGCSRLQPLRGVPTVEQDEAVSLITADLVIWLAWENAPQAAPAAAALVEVGTEPTGEDLPAPPARNVALIDKACGPKPGDHGKEIED